MGNSSSSRNKKNKKKEEEDNKNNNNEVNEEQESQENNKNDNKELLPPEENPETEVTDIDQDLVKLLRCCQEGDKKTIEELVQQGVVVDRDEVLDPLIPSESSMKRKYTSPLITAVTCGHVEVVQYFVSLGCSLDKTFQQVSESGHVVHNVTYFMIACQSKQQEVIKYLVSTKVIEKTRLDSERNTFLHYLCRHEHKLLNKGSDKEGIVEVDDDVTSTMKLLLELNILTSDVPGYSNIRNNTAMHSLAYFNNVSAMKLLLEVMYGPIVICNFVENGDVDYLRNPVRAPSLKTLLKNDVGMTPLHIAALRNSPDMVLVLLNYGFDPDVQERSGLDVYQLAKVVDIQHRVKDSTNVTKTVLKGPTVEEILNGYKAARSEAALRRKLRGNYDDESTLGGLDAASSITFENTYIEEDSASSSPGFRKKRFNKKIENGKEDETRSEVIIVDHSSLPGGGKSRTVNPYPKAQKLTKRQMFVRGMLDDSGSVTNKKKKKMKKKIRAKSPKKQPQPQRNAKDRIRVPFIGGSTTEIRNFRASSPSKSVQKSTHSLKTNSVTPGKQRSSAHYSQVHRGNTAAESLASSRHIRARKAWATMSTAKPYSAKVTPSPTVSRGHRVPKNNSSSQKKISKLKLPANIHSSPSGILTITFS